MNNGVRIVLDRRADGHWYWELTTYGERHTGPRGEINAELAAIAATTFRNHLKLFKDKRERLSG
jgi:hypothetical protein